MDVLLCIKLLKTGQFRTSKVAKPWILILTEITLLGCALCNPGTSEITGTSAVWQQISMIHTTKKKSYNPCVVATATLHHSAVVRGTTGASAPHLPHLPPRG